MEKKMKALEERIRYNRHQIKDLIEAIGTLWIRVGELETKVKDLQTEPEERH